MTEVILRKKGNALVPVDDQGRDLLAKLKEGRDVGCDVIQRRNPRHHRLYFAILQFVRLHAVNSKGEALFESTDTEMLSAAVKIACGLVRTFIDTKSGKTAFVPLSISWAAMDQTKFNQFFDVACKAIAERWLPTGTTAEDVRRELLLMVDGPHAIHERVA